MAHFAFVKNFLGLVYHKLRNRNISLKAKIIGDNIFLGKNFTLPAHCIISTQLGGRIVAGDNVSLGRFAQLLTFGGDIVIGNNVTIGEFSILYGHGGLEVGDDVLIASHTIIVSANHNFENLDIPIRLQGETKKGVKIKNDVWIGSNAVILDGVVIEKGCVIGAGSVVTKSLEGYSVAAGNPARVINVRGK